MIELIIDGVFICWAAMEYDPFTRQMIAVCSDLVFSSGFEG